MPQRNGRRSFQTRGLVKSKIYFLFFYITSSKLKIDSLFTIVANVGANWILPIPMKFQSYSQILSVVVYVTNFNMCNFIIITFSALKLQVALYFRNRLAPSVNIESRTVTLWHLVLKKILYCTYFSKPVEESRICI